MLRPQTKTEKLRDLFQAIQNNIFLLSEVKNSLQRITDQALALLNEREGANEKADDK